MEVAGQHYTSAENDGGQPCCVGVADRVGYRLVGVNEWLSVTAVDWIARFDLRQHR